MKYQDILKVHLAEYKRTQLGITESGIFYRNGRAYEHILPAAQAMLNVFDEARPTLKKLLEKKQIKLHRDFHHLNSSQAFAFNLFFSYFDGDATASSTLLRALGQQGKLTDWIPEAVPDPDADAYVSRHLRPSAMRITFPVTFPLLKSLPDFWAA